MSVRVELINLVGTCKAATRENVSLVFPVKSDLNLSGPMRKPTICLGENKDTGELPRS